MEGVVLLVAALALVALFFLLRHEGNAKRGKERGELQEPLQNAIGRGLRSDLTWVWKKVRRDA